MDAGRVSLTGLHEAKNMNIDSATNATETPNIKWTHPSLSYKTPRAKSKAENSRRKKEAWAWSKAIQRKAYRFLLERNCSGRPGRESSCTSDDLDDACAEFFQSEAARIAALTNARDALGAQMTGKDRS